MASQSETLVFGSVDGTDLHADLHLPAGAGPHPVVVGVPGGAWLRGHRTGLAHWGRHLSQKGYALLSIDYRRSTAGSAFPGNARDVAAALAFVASQGSSLGLDHSRLAVLGASAGAHLAALVALSDDFATPPLSALIGVYGIYDLVAQWQANLPRNALPGQESTERMLGAAPYDDQRLYFAASPIRHVRYEGTVPTLLIWGDADREVLPAQSEAFATALQQARFPLRTIVVPGAGHLWFSEEPIDDSCSYTARVAPGLVRFLDQNMLPPHLALVRRV